MARWDDEDEWVGGEPPEGRHTREQADPGFWAQNWPAVSIAMGVLGILIVVVVVLAVAS